MSFSYEVVHFRLEPGDVLREIEKPEWDVLPPENKRMGLLRDGQLLICEPTDPPAETASDVLG